MVGEMRFCNGTTECHRLVARRDLQFREQVVHVVLDGRRRNIERVCDFFVGTALIEKRQHLLLAPRENAARREHRRFRSSSSRAQELRRDLG